MTMLNLIKKEFALCVHPTAYVFLTFACFVFIPNYPYEVMFFFSTLSVYFTCLASRENGDLRYTCALPADRKNVAASRILTCAILQLAQIAAALILICIKSTLLPEMRNMAGLDANTATLAAGFVIFGLFNIIYFPAYFGKPDSVGKPFVLTSVVTFAVIGLLTALTFTAPFFRDVLDTPDPAYIGAKLGALAAGIAFYAALTCASLKISAVRFGKTDL